MGPIGNGGNRTQTQMKEPHTDNQSLGRCALVCFALVWSGLVWFNLVELRSGTSWLKRGGEVDQFRVWRNCCSPAKVAFGALQLIASDELELELELEQRN